MTSFLIYFYLQKKKNNFRFVPRYEREISVSSTDSGLSVATPHITAPSTPEIDNQTSDASPKHSSNYSINLLQNCKNEFIQILFVV